MTAMLHKIEDPRSWVAKMTRKELEYLGIKEGRNFPNGMPAELMKQDFIVTPPKQQPRPLTGRLGQTGVGKRIPPYQDWLKIAFSRETYIEESTIQETDYMQLMKQQWESENTRPNLENLDMKALRDKVRSMGIKVDRKDNKQSLIVKINGQNAS